MTLPPTGASGAPKRKIPELFGAGDDLVPVVYSGYRKMIMT
jgi:hypothetical protein